MSHTILYNRLFVRMPDNTLVALVQSGDNNVTTINPRTGREVRSREWSSWSFGEGKPSYTETEIESYLSKRFEEVLADATNHLKFHPEDWNGGDENDEATRRFGHYAAVAVSGRPCGKTTFGMYRNFFRKGIANAVTLEEYVRTCGGFRIVQYDDKGFAKSEPLTMFHTVNSKWREATAGGKTAWLIPVSPLAAERFAKETAKRNVPKAIVIMKYRKADGTEESSYVKSLVPFILTQDCLEAATIPRKTVRDTNLFAIAETAFPDRHFLEYEVHNV
jgi:hypothetical protein